MTCRWILERICLEFAENEIAELKNESTPSAHIRVSDAKGKRQLQRLQKIFPWQRTKY